VGNDTLDAAQALEWLQAGESFDLAILDMQMPGMDGLMLAREIRKLPGRMTMPLVLLASIGVRSDHPDFTSASIAGSLTKPIKPAQLQETLLRVMSRSTPSARTAAVPSAKLDPTFASRFPLRVLLCDDNIVNQKVALRLLQQMGYRADLAANGSEALAALDRQPYDLIFMDVMMPEMGGLEATRLIRQRQQQPLLFPNYKPAITIVAMTASAMQGDREKCLAAGMDDYVAKPVRLEEVRTVMERWAAVAGKIEPAETPTTGEVAQPAANAPTQSTPAAAPSEDDPVDMSRLLDFTDGDQGNLRELATLYLDQTGQQVEQLKAAVQAGSAPEVRRLAHSCAGASATCGMRRLVPLLRELERQGFEGQLTNATQLSHQVSEEFDRIRQFLEAYLAEHSNLAAKP
jgi:CheY-like chemotaxis protein